MPKCPYSYVFYEKYKPTTTASTHEPTQTSTFSLNNGTKATIDRNLSPTTPEEVVTTESDELTAKRNILTFPKMEGPTQSKAAKFSSKETSKFKEQAYLLATL